MEDKDAFKRWLESQGAKSKHSQNNPVYAIQTIERKLNELGTPFPDLDTAWREDEFKSLHDSLNQILKDALNGGQDFRILFPKTANPKKRIRDSLTHLKRYGRFRREKSSEPPAPNDADPGQDGGIDLSRLGKLRKRFEAACPDFRSFEYPGVGAEEELAFKRNASKDVQAVVHAHEGKDDQALGKEVLKILTASKAPLVFYIWRTELSQSPELEGEFHAAIGRLARSKQTAQEALLQAYDALAALKERGVEKLGYGERLRIAFSALSMVRPHEAAPLQITKINQAWKYLTGKKLFVDAEGNLVSDYQRFSAVFSEIFQVMRDDPQWRWQPKDWLDVQGFLWIALESQEEEETPTSNGAPDVVAPLNQILYGPPRPSARPNSPCLSLMGATGSANATQRASVSRNSASTRKKALAISPW